MLFLTNPDPATGDYRLGGLPTGDYLVQFSGWQGLDSYVGYYDGVTSIDLAQPVPVTLGEVTAGVDGELGIPPGGVIAGEITDPYGRSFDFTRVQAFRDEGGSWVLAGEAETVYYEAEYELPLPPGIYRLRFEGGSFLQPDLPATEVFDDVLTLDEGTDVEVVLDQRIEGFDVAVGNLATGGLTGTVTDAATGAPLSGIEVWVADRKGRVLYDQIATTDASGGYDVSGLWPERYTVELYDPTYTYQTRVIGQVLVGEDPVDGVDGSLDIAPPGTLPGAITGTVRDELGQPLFGVRVSASSLDGTSFGAALTDSAGSYRVRDLPSGQYEVRFDSRDGFQVTEFFDDVTDPDAATPVAVAMAATTAGIDADLAPAGIVTGSITNRFGNPFQIATAIVYEDDGGEWRQVASTSVVSDSAYRIPGVPVGAYRVQLIGQSFFGGTALTEYFDDAPSIELGTDVEVAAGQVTAGISGSLGQGPPGAIAGTVTDGAGTALEGILVRVYDEGFELEAEAVTGPDGGYEVPDLYRGRYSVEFTDPQGVYPGEVYDNVASLDLASPVLVGDAPVTGIDAALDGAGTGPGGGGIRGVVTDVATGAGIEGIRVSCVDELFGFPVDCSTYTTADGSYQLGGFLTSGTYIVRFTAPNGGWVEEWYDDVRPPLQPTPVAVTEGAWTDGVDAVLEPAGAISGTVTSEGGGEFSRLTVTAFRLDGAGWQPFAGTTVIYDSQYELGGLPAGTYRLKFLGGSIFNPNTGIVEFYDDALTVDDGTDVPVVVGQTTAGIDAVLEPRGPGAISGLVTDAAGTGLAGIEVRVYDDQFALAETGTTAIDGSYLIDDLFSGRYSVEFVDPTGTYPSEAYDNVASIDLATPVLVGQGTTAGIDAVLDGPGGGPGGGGVRGVVTDAVSGAPIEGIEVRCVDEFFGLVDGCAATTGPDGRFRLGGFLPTGAYFVEFRASDGFFAGQWYDGVRPPLQPTPVAVVEGAWTDGVDAALEPAGGISGTVINEGGNAYSRTTVTAFRQTGSSWVEYARTDLFYDTAYELRGLPEGTYRIKFRGGSIFNPSYGVEEYFDDVGSIDLATDVEVSVGVVTPGISAVLGNLGGGGDVMNPAFDTGLEGWQVESSAGVSVHHGVPDVGGSALSGSLEITDIGGAPPAATVSQCLPVDAGSVVDFGAWSRVTGAGASAAATSVRLEVYDDVDCNGTLLAGATSPVRIGVHDWSPVVGSASVPTGATAGRLVLSVDAPVTGELAANWDEAFVERATDALFVDGFESGSTGAWGDATP
ncbi:MAG: carboxypeptidase regulatory-like domain-containing protein [Holophagae bacterium]